MISAGIPLSDEKENFENTARIWGNMNKRFLAEVLKDVKDDPDLTIQQRTLLLIGQFKTMRQLRNLEFAKDRDLTMKTQNRFDGRGPQTDKELAAWIQELRVARPKVAAAWEEVMRNC